MFPNRYKDSGLILKKTKKKNNMKTHQYFMKTVQEVGWIPNSSLVPT